MTEERLTEILIDHRVCERMPNGRTFAVPSALEAMKQAVNEALDEAADNADTICANAKKGSDTCGAWCDSAIVNKQTILNLKVK